VACLVEGLWNHAEKRSDEMAKNFPAKFPLKKPTDLELSPAIERLYDYWGCKSEQDNEFYSLFKYSRPEGFPDDGFISRRDPSKIIKVGDLYYVYYTCRNTGNNVVAAGQDDESTPSTDWDLADIYVATSKDGFTWEERGPALKRSPKGQFGCRSLSTPDILPWKGKYYLFVQVYSDLIRNDSCPVSVGVADNPLGPFELKEKELIPRGPDGAWDSNSIHDPYPLPYKGKVYLYYKGHPQDSRNPEHLHIAHGVAIADSPEGPFEKHPTNPVTNSGHETMLWPYREGIASLLIRNGNEGHTVQYAPDGVSFEMKAIVDMPPHAGGACIPDLDKPGDGRGILWGMCFGNPGRDVENRSHLLRFDCSLSRDLERPGFKSPRHHQLEQFLAFPLKEPEKLFLKEQGL
jgi:hypothetical protein